jgi:hypothetical protein
MPCWKMSTGQFGRDSGPPNFAYAEFAFGTVTSNGISR